MTTRRMCLPVGSPFSPAFSAPGPQRTEPKTFVFGPPRESFHPFYLEGDYHGGSGKPVGRKRCPVRSIPNEPDIPNDNAATQSRVAFHVPGTAWKGRIRVHNLHPIELAALVWCLTFGETDGPWRHAIGRAKGYGYGRLRLEKLAWRRPPKIAGEVETNDWDALARTFENWMTERLGQDFVETETVRRLRAYANPEMGGKHGRNLAYPPVERFKTLKGPVDADEDWWPPMMAGTDIPLTDFRQIFIWPLAATTTGRLREEVTRLAECIGEPWQPIADPLRYLETDEEGLSPEAYQEFVYFHGFVQRFLYDRESTALRLFERNDIRALEVRLAPDRGLSRLEVDRLHLYLFDAGVATLVVETSSKLLTFADALTFGDRTRRAYPPFWKGEGEPGLYPQRMMWLDGEGAALADSSSEGQSDFIAHVREKRRAPVAVHWRGASFRTPRTRRLRGGRPALAPRR